MEMPDLVADCLPFFFFCLHCRLPPVQEVSNGKQNGKKSEEEEALDEDLDEVEKENLLLRKSAEQMLGKLAQLKKELEQSQQQVAKLEAQLAEAPNQQSTHCVSYIRHSLGLTRAWFSGQVGLRQGRRHSRINGGK